MPSHKRYTINQSIQLPEEAVRLGRYSGFDLYQNFIPVARHSARAIVYVYARELDANEVTFAQICAAHREVTGDASAEEVERTLTIDALVRAKRRIKAASYAAGEAYTVELEDRDL